MGFSQSQNHILKAVASENTEIRTQKSNVFRSRFGMYFNMLKKIHVAILELQKISNSFRLPSRPGLAHKLCERI